MLKKRIVRDTHIPVSDQQQSSICRNERCSMKRALILLIGEILEDPRVLKTARSIAERGVSVTVACTNPSGRSEKEDFEGLVIRRFPHRGEFILKRLYTFLKSRLPSRMGQTLAKGHEDAPSRPLAAWLKNRVLSLNFRHFMGENMAINRKMAAAFRNERFDLVHANDFDTLPAGRELKQCGAADALLYDAHEYWAGIGVHGSVANEQVRVIERDGIEAADHVVTVNPVIAETMQEEYGLTTTPAVVMNCPYHDGGETVEPVIHSPLRVVYQGKLQAFRGLDELVLAFQDIENAELTFSGFGPLEESLKRLAESLGLGDRVHFLGRFKGEDTVTILKEHDIGIMPFRDVTLNMRYTSPNKMFDYAMAGLAIAASDFPFLRQIVVNHGMGVMLDAATPEGIAATLSRMITDKDALLAYKTAARRAALESFTWEKQFAAYPWTGA